MHLARLLRLGEVVAVTVPTESQEAARDLVRAREDARGDLMRTRTDNRNCHCAKESCIPVGRHGPGNTKYVCGRNVSIGPPCKPPTTAISRQVLSRRP